MNFGTFGLTVFRTDLSSGVNEGDRLQFLTLYRGLTADEPVPEPAFPGVRNVYRGCVRDVFRDVYS
jgi:hypothetical protein